MDVDMRKTVVRASPQRIAPIANDSDAQLHGKWAPFGNQLRVRALPPLETAGREPLRGQLARNLRLCRHERAMSQTELANTSGLSRALIRRIESGHFAVSLDALERLADALEIEASLLIGPLSLTRPCHELRDVRISKGFSQSRLAAESGVSRCSINRIENGKAVAGPRAKKALAQALGVHPATIK